MPNKGLSHPIRWVLWILAVLFYFYEYFLRVTPSVMAFDLMRTFGIGAGMVGLLSALYFFTYAPMQLPVGLMIDRYGARRLLSIASVICGIGTYLFGTANILGVAEFGRLLVGFGASFAFIGLVYLSSHLFESRKLAYLVGLGNSFGMLGAVFGLGPFSMMKQAFGYKDTMIAFAIFGIVLGVVIYLVTRFEPKELKSYDKEKESSILFWKHLKETSLNSKTWLNAAIALAFYSITSAFGSMWAVPFFHEGYGMLKEDAAFTGSLFFMGWIVGGPIIGFFSDRIKKRKPFIMISSLLSLITISLILYYPIWTNLEVYLLVFLLGLFASAQLLSYALAVEFNAPGTKGSAIAITNFTVFMGGCVLQPLIGILLDMDWSGNSLHGARDFSYSNFQFAYSVFPILLLVAFCLSFFLNNYRVRR